MQLKTILNRVEKQKGFVHSEARMTEAGQIEFTLQPRRSLIMHLPFFVLVGKSRTGSRSTTTSIFCLCFGAYGSELTGLPMGFAGARACRGSLLPDFPP